MTTPPDIIGIVKELQEEWRPLKSWEAYEVSNLGRVRSRHRGGRIRKPHRKNAYLYVDLWQNGDHIEVPVHRLVLYAFGPPATSDMEPNHKDGNKENNRIDNLEWVTRSENQLHAIRMGLATPTPPSKLPGYVPWNKGTDRTCSKCGKPDSVKARKMCTKCWQRWRYGYVAMSKKDLQAALLEREEKVKELEAQLAARTLSTAADIMWDECVKNNAKLWGEWDCSVDGKKFVIRIQLDEVPKHSELEEKLRIAEEALELVATGIWRDKARNACGLAGASLTVHTVETALSRLRQPSSPQA